MDAYAYGGKPFDRPCSPESYPLWIRSAPFTASSVISGSMSQPDFPVSGIPLNEWNLPIRRSRNRQWQAFFWKPVHGLCVNTKSIRNMMSKKQLLLLLPALFAAISTLPANAAHILTGGGTGAANASGTGISMQLNPQNTRLKTKLDQSKFA